MQFQFRKLFAAGTAAVMLLSGMTFSRQPLPLREP